MLREPVEDVAAHARRIPDQVLRLRYLRTSVKLAPQGSIWRTRWGLFAAAVIGAASVIAGMTIMGWLRTYWFGT